MATEPGGIGGIAPRPRRGWETVDLGFAMLRAWWRPVFVPWLAIALAARLLIAGAFYRWPGAGAWLAWWLRPLFDCVALFLVESCFLGAPAGVAATLRAFPGRVRRDWLGLLLVYRLDPARSFHLPLGQVEGLSGPERRQRAAWLRHGEGFDLAVGLTVACWILEVGTAVALTVLLDVMLPGSRSPEELLARLFMRETGGPGPGQFAGTAVGIAAFLLIEPFYVAGGYSLYLSRRAWLEGWDVQDAFRRMAERLESRSQGGRRAGRAAALLPWLLAGSVLLAHAAASADAMPDTAARPARAASSGAPGPAASSGLAAPGEPPEQAIREILRDEDFQTRRRITTWRLRDGLLPRLRGVRVPGLGMAALALRWTLLALAVLLAAALVVWLVHAGLAAWRSRAKAPAGPRPPPASGPGLRFGSAHAEPLPDDVPAAAWALWERGEAAAALGLLYRGALAAAVERDHLAVAGSWTEEDCLSSLYPRLGQSRGDYFARLTRAWQAAAYGRRPPAAEEARTLCGLWSRHFGEPA